MFGLKFLFLLQFFFSRFSAKLHIPIFDSCSYFELFGIICISNTLNTEREIEHNLYTVDLSLKKIKL